MMNMGHAAGKSRTFSVEAVLVLQVVLLGAWASDANAALVNRDATIQKKKKKKEKEKF
jgi:hypothetical protein